MTPEQKQRLKEVEENRRIWHGNMGQVTTDIDFLLSLVKSQEAGEALAEQIVNSSLCAEPSGNCEESAAVHIRDLIRSVAAIPAPQYDALCERHRHEFTTFHVGGCLECWKRSEQDSVATSMRSACVEKVKILSKKKMAHYDLDIERFGHLLEQAIALDEAVVELESLTLQEQETKQ